MELDEELDDVACLVSLGGGRLVPRDDDTSAPNLSSSTSRGLYMQLRKARKRVLEDKKDREQNQKKSKATFAQLFCEFPMVAKATGFKKKLLLSNMPLVLADAYVKLAVSRKTGVTDSHTKDKAVAIMAALGLKQLVKRISQLLCLQDKECIENRTPIFDADVSQLLCLQDKVCIGNSIPIVPIVDADVEAVVKCVRSLMWCWDEAEQKLQRFRQRNSRRKENKGNMSQQTMVQSGSAGNFTKSMGSDEICVDRDKIIVRTLRLESTKQEYILNGIQRSVPGGNLETCLHMFTSSNGNERLLASWLLLGADRASQNYSVLTRILIEVEKNPKVIAHVDFCGAHGVALARSRPKPSKRLNTALSAWTKWLRVDSNVSQVAKTLEDLVLRQRPILWYQSERPESEIGAATAFKKCLFPEDAVLWRREKWKNGRTRLVQSALHITLDEVLACRRWTIDDNCKAEGGVVPSVMVHWCKLITFLDKDGNSTTSWCCRTELEARQKNHDILRSWLLGTVWNPAADNRWTTQPATQRRLMVAETIDTMVTHMLNEIALGFSLQNAGVVAALEQLMKNNLTISRCGTSCASKVSIAPSVFKKNLG